MVDYSYCLYDTGVFGVAASVETSLFQVSQGGDATHTKSFTNSRGAGQMPQNEEFEIDHIGVAVDMNLPTADYIAVWLNSYLEIRVNDETLFIAPLRALAQANAYGGHYTEAAASNEALIGLAGDGYTLKIPILIPGGTAFRVNIFQGTALATANTLVKVMLNGTLSRK